jgi:uncharacterized protein YydD (DUF2326 family)
MILLKLYSEPLGLLHTFNESGIIEFVNGINFIYGKKTDIGSSLNSIGKSSILDLIDFCLLASTTKRSNPRLAKAKDEGIFDGYKVVLEFEIENIVYIIKRSFEHNIIEFGETSSIYKYKIKDLKILLFDLIFGNDEYIGELSNQWFRDLIAFYLKIQKKKAEKFTDPIQYQRWLTVSKANQYHLYFLGIDNFLACENYTVQEEIKKKGALIKEIETIVEDTYKLKISEATAKLSKINRQIRELEKAVTAFQLLEHYHDVEERANQITSEIKLLWQENYRDKRKLDAYRESVKIFGKEISTRKIQNLYKETSELLGVNIKKTLDDAIRFREKLSASRSNFLKTEILVLEKKLEHRITQIEKLDEERSSLFTLLSEVGAIADLTNVYLEIGQKQKIRSELEGQIKLHYDLSKEKASLTTEESQIVENYYEFLDNKRQAFADFNEIFSNIYSTIYPDAQKDAFVSVSINEKTKAKLIIDVSFEGDEGQGKNQARTLIYDLAIVCLATENNFNLPRFLIYDGIFNGMDKSHFISVYEFIEKMVNKGKPFQYIVTLNEEGTLSENFGDADKVTPENIEREAIAVLTPTTKAFGKDF